MKTIIVGGMCWIIAASLPLFGQLIYAFGPAWVRQTTVDGYAVLGIGVIGTLVAFAVVLFTAGMMCFYTASANEGK